VGNVLTIGDSNAGGTQTQTFTYDDLDRLYSAQASGGTEGAYAQEIYQYSTIGNLTSKAGVVQTYGVAQAGTCPDGALSKAHAVVTVGLNAYCYDQNGNMRRRNIAFNSYTLSYDGENRLTGVSGSATATFVYDGDGNRVKGTVNGATTIYIGNYYEWTGSTTTAKKYYYAGSQRIAMRTGTSTLNYLLGDHLGSTSITADSAGARVAELMYKPWGENRYTFSTTPTTLRFTGQRQESGLGGTEGLYYYGARWYDPTLGRFAQADSIVPGAFNPQSLNRYSYVLNNPLKYTDPTGHMEDDGCNSTGCTIDLPVDSSSTSTPNPPTGCPICATAEPTDTPTASPLTFLTPVPTEEDSIGPTPPGHYVTVTKVDWSRVDWVDVGIDVLGIAGDLTVAVAMINPIPVAKTVGVAAVGVTSFVEVVGLIKDLNDFSAAGDPSDLILTLEQKVALDVLKLSPVVGSVANVIDLYITLSEAQYTETIYIPDN
jgi:RHS repeat-associated protein